MNLQLVSFKLCPFVQQVSLSLLCRSMPFEQQYIDLADPPDWFLEMSPLKKVPILVADDRALFDSISILEFIEEVSLRKLHPVDPFERAHHRAWVQFTNSLMWAAFHLSVKESQEEYNLVVGEMHDRFDQLEQAIVGPDFFNGVDFTLVDAALAPLFQRLAYLEELKPGIYDQNRHRRVCALSRSLANGAYIAGSCVPDIKELYYELLGRRKGYIAQFLPEVHKMRSREKHVY